MDFSEDWKTLLPISSVHSPPLLFSGSSAKPLGPLLFTPCQETLTPLFSSPSLSLPISPPSHFSLPKALQTLTRPSNDPFIPPSVISSIASTEFSSQSDATEPIYNTNNNLSMLKCPGNNFLIFFPTGENSDQIGAVKLSMERNRPIINIDKGGEIFTSEIGFKFRILKILVTSVETAASGFPSVSGHSSSVTVGFLLACTLYSVYWFRVDIGSLGLNNEKPVLVHLGMKVFSSSVLHACWSPHMVEESIILLENGDLVSFDLITCSKAVKLPKKMNGTKVKVSWENSDLGLDLEKGEWLSCDFSWHPRILIVACSSAVFLVDWRFEKINVSILATIQVYGLDHSILPDRFLTFCRAGCNGFYFSVATKYKLYLFDIRKPLMPVLQWVHGLDTPSYINVFKLSELRSTSKEEDKHRWATESGYAILLGSFWNCEFSLFCYGPSLPTPYESVASKILNLSNSFYAWELPSALSLSGRDCCCGDCHLSEDFLKETLPEWIDWRQKKEMVLGFCVIGEELTDLQVEADVVGGFRIVRLVSSGKLESQIYRASWDFVCQMSKESMNHTLPKFEDSLLYSFGDRNYKFPRRFKYLNLGYLLAYLNGDLSKLLTINKQRSCEGPRYTISYTQHNREVLCEKLKAIGIDQIGTLPAIANVFKDISLPMTVYEIALSRTWASLPLDLLELAFSTYSDLLEVLVDQKKVSLEFLDVPNLPQSPPFLLRNPSSRSDKWSHKVQPGDALVGPALPLHVLLTLREVNKEKNCSVLGEEPNEFVAETELVQQCDAVTSAISGMDFPGSSSEFRDSHAVSLADDRDENWIGSKETKSMFLYKPSAFGNGNSPTVGYLPEKPVPGDERFDTCIVKMPEKKFAPNPKKELGGMEMFDEVCPIKLKFDSPPMDFVPTELKDYKLLKRGMLKWHESFKRYQDFSTAYLNNLKGYHS